MEAFFFNKVKLSLNEIMRVELKVHSQATENWNQFISKCSG